MPRGLRINLVSPGWLSETLAQLGADTTAGTPAADVARHYLDCVTGDHTGRTIIP